MANSRGNFEIAGSHDVYTESRGCCRTSSNWISQELDQGHAHYKSSMELNRDLHIIISGLIKCYSLSRTYQLLQPALHVSALVDPGRTVIYHIHSLSRAVQVSITDMPFLSANDTNGVPNFSNLPLIRSPLSHKPHNNLNIASLGLCHTPHNNMG